MTEKDISALKAKVAVANGYLEQVMKNRGKIDNYDVYKVVSRSMRPFVDVVTDKLSADMIGGYVTLKEAV